MDLAKRAKEIIGQIQYITIASSSRDCMPWNSPVYSAFDEKYTFFWTSTEYAKHSKNIKENPNVALVIYDSTAPEGTGEGVYVQAEAMMVTDEDEIKYAIKYLYGRTGKKPRMSTDFMGDSLQRIFKAVPKKFWMNGDEEVKGYVVDKRDEVTL